ncbi:MAG: PD-(D/E)XK nuclease family protein [Porphyromonadaceae bacterium]|nr:PD-(D/E)XK nuclease family protein [Porphyromonadaceae bacterium]
MKPFLQQVAAHYCEQLIQNSQSLAQTDALRYRFVFPSRRSLLFFRHYLGHIAHEPMFAPKCETVTEFIHGFVPNMRILDRTALLFELYRCRQEALGGQELETFEEFLYWGNIILKDFDLVDRHLISPKELYTNLADYREIQEDFSYMEPDTLRLIESFWNGFRNLSAMDEGERVDYRRSFIEFWQSLWPLYDRFTQHLDTSECGYEGRIYRQVAEHAIDLVDTLHEQTRIVFVGLFDITPAEFKLFRVLKRRGYAEFCWDEQVHILTDGKHLASKVLAKNKQLLGQVAGGWLALEGAHYLPKRIEVVSCASTVSQVKALPHILEKLGVANDDENALTTAIILPSEQLLLPTVSSIPADYKHLNITLGYPLNRTPVSVLMNRWIRLLLSSQDHRSYRSDLLIALLGIHLLGERYPELLELASRIRQQKNYHVSTIWLLEQAKICIEDLEEKEQIEFIRLIEILLCPSDQAGQFLSDLQDFLQGLMERSRLPEEGPLEDIAIVEGHKRVEISILDAEFIHHYIRLVNRLRSLTEEYNLDNMPLSSVIRLLEGLVRGITIPFEGDPLRGLQIMGLRESSALHFPRLIYLSAQEGQMPRSGHEGTLIPQTLRRGYRLPTSEWQDATEAYRFYQSIAKAEQLLLIYGQDDAMGGKGEESRYIHQLELLYGVPIHRRVAQSNPRKTPLEPIVISKQTPEVANELARFWGETTLGGRALSASRLATYIVCPLRFYYESILEVYEEEEPQELMAANEFGSILHGTMEQIYAPYVGGHPIPQSYLERLIAEGNTEIDRAVTQLYMREYNKQEASALDKLYCDMIATYIRCIIAYDAQHEPITYLASEAHLEAKIDLGDNRQINFKGDIDRLDLVQGEDDPVPRVRVLDYKTGRDLEPSFSSWEQLTTQTERKAVLQTLLYCELLWQNKEVIPGHLGSYAIQPGVMRLREMSGSAKEFHPYVTIGAGKGNKVMLSNYVMYRDEYLSVLRELLREIFDLERPFVQCQDIDHCTYCRFRLSCGR